MSWHAPSQLHTRVVAVIPRDGDIGGIGLSAVPILVTSGHSRADDEDYSRPPTIEVLGGEHAEQSLRRGIHSLLGATVIDTRTVGTLERLLDGVGESVREITYVFLCTVDSPALYGSDDVELSGESAGVVAGWQSLSTFRDDDAALYPAGLMELIDRS